MADFQDEIRQPDAVRPDYWKLLEDEIRSSIISLGVPEGHSLKVTLKAEVELIEERQDG